MKKLNKTGPSTDSWGTPLVTDLNRNSFLMVISIRLETLKQTKKRNAETKREIIYKVQPSTAKG